jgi:hypothetical protein
MQAKPETNVVAPNQGATSANKTNLLTVGFLYTAMNAREKSNSEVYGLKSVPYLRDVELIISIPRTRNLVCFLDSAGIRYLSTISADPARTSSEKTLPMKIPKGNERNSLESRKYPGGMDCSQLSPSLKDEIR